jgi:hypothetical protein
MMSENLDDGVWCDLMSCHITDVQADRNGVVVFSLAYKNVPDMTGTIKRAKQFDPNVNVILAMAPGKPLVRYVRGVGDFWSYC